MKKIGFKTKLIMWMTLINFIPLLFSYLYFLDLKITKGKVNIEKNLIEVSKLVKDDESIKKELSIKKNSGLIEKKTKEYIDIFEDVDIIVVGDIDGVKYSHLDKKQIGEKFVNPLNWKSLLEKKGYFSKMKGSMGVTFRRFEPIVLNDKVVGFIMVGKYDSIMQKMKMETILILGTLFIVSLLISFILAIILASAIKKSLLGLEPDQIKRMYLEEKLIINSIESGLVAINKELNIIKVNEIYYEKCKNIDPKEFIERVKECLGLETMKRVEVTINREIFFLRILPIKTEKEYYGNILLIKKREDVVDYARKLTGVDKLVEGMRAHIHEFKNRLHVILGLINLNKLDMVKKYVLELQSKNEYDFQKYENIKSSFLKAVLLGKESICEERGIEFKLDLESKVNIKKPQSIIEDISTILGNLIENAIESFDNEKIEGKFIEVKIKEGERKIFIEVKDNGKKIDDEVYEKMCNYGYSTKGEQRGIGLYLINEKLKLYNGKFFVERKEREKIFKIEMEIY